MVPGQFYYPWIEWHRYKDNNWSENSEFLLEINDNYPEKDYVTLIFPDGLQPSLIKILNFFWKEFISRNRYRIPIDKFNQLFSSFMEAFWLENFKLGWEPSLDCLFLTGDINVLDSKEWGNNAFGTSNSVPSKINLKLIHNSKYIETIRLDKNYKPYYRVRINLSVPMLVESLMLDPHFYISNDINHSKNFERFKLVHMFHQMPTKEVFNMCQRL